MIIPTSLQTVDQYVLTVKASDLNGAPGCNSGLATFNVQILDVNDNAPVLEQDSVRQHLFNPCVPTFSSVVKLDSVSRTCNIQNTEMYDYRWATETVLLFVSSFVYSLKQVLRRTQKTWR